MLTEAGLAKGEADWHPPDKRITLGEWLSFAVDRAPKPMEQEIAEQESVKASRGVKVNRIAVRAAQIPALFDFTKQDTFVIIARTGQ